MSTNWYEKLFKESKPLSNYKYLLELILFQIQTESDWERGYEHCGYIIEHYIDNLAEPYRDKIFEIIPYDILKEKILDVPFGFGTAFQNQDTSKADEELFYKIHEALQMAESDSEHYLYCEDNQKGCRKCGCSAEKDADGERICFCDTCCKIGCDIIQ